jgi:hypothetical protein
LHSFVVRKRLLQRRKKKRRRLKRLQVILEGAQEVGLETHALVRAPHELGVRRQSRRQVRLRRGRRRVGGERANASRARQSRRGVYTFCRRGVGRFYARGGVLERPLQRHQAV